MRVRVELSLRKGLHDPTMSSFIIFQCPETGFNVQTRIIREQPRPGDGKFYEPFSCPICTRTHLIDPVTGKVLGASE